MVTSRRNTVNKSYGIKSRQGEDKLRVRSGDEVVFKGTKNGVLVILNDQLDFGLLKKKLVEKLDGAEKFFYPGVGVTIDVGSRVLSSTQLIELEQLLNDKHGLQLLNVVHSEPAEEEAAAAASTPGLSVRRKDADSHLPETGGVMGDTMMIKRTLRSGQRVRFAGNIVVLGDVNPGAEVIAGGDILVMGALRGVAHAGASGSTDSIVAAFRLLPTQLRISNLISRSPDGEAGPSDRPEIAHIRDGRVVIESYPSHTSG